MPEQPVFDTLAGSYDDTFTQSLVGRSQRSEVWYYLDKHLTGGSLRILELNCGTGEDALYLAERGHHITATDISPEMIRIASQKNTSPSLLEFRVMDANDIRVEEKYDLVFSNFGGLNFLDTNEFGKLAEKLDNILKPGGKFILVLIHSYSFWEMMYFSLRFRFREAFRRTKRKSEFRGTAVYYYPKRQIKKIFSSFSMVGSYPIGVITPPGYDEKFLRFFWGKPRLQQTERKGERLAAKVIGADHWMYIFQKKPKQ